MEHEILITKVYNHFKKNIKNWINGDITDISKWIGLGSAIVEFVDKFDDLKGKEKKEMVLITIKNLINDPDILTELTEETREKISMIVLATLPTTIDILISASRGELNLNTKYLKKIFKCCYSKQ